MRSECKASCGESRQAKRQRDAAVTLDEHRERLSPKRRVSERNDSARHMLASRKGIWYNEHSGRILLKGDSFS